jgi:hypothetical protein
MDLIEKENVKFKQKIGHAQRAGAGAPNEEIVRACAPGPTATAAAAATATAAFAEAAEDGDCICAVTLSKHASQTRTD